MGLKGIEISSLWENWQKRPQPSAKELPQGPSDPGTILTYILKKLHLFIYVFMCQAHACHSIREEVRGQLRESTHAVDVMSPRDGIQITRLGRKYPYLPSHLPGPNNSVSLGPCLLLLVTQLLLVSGSPVPFPSARSCRGGTGNSVVYPPQVLQLFGFNLS